ncbi:MAG: hypothetical protein SFY80_15440 [Verrucomicrobiota bacterium]|nr:hypothetical protein [Verrucomicrobiota bacterium]
MYTVTHKEKTLAIIIPAGYNQPGVHFFTPNNFSQQLAYMHHPVGQKIKAHTHNEVKREVLKTLEVLFIRKGDLRVDFYESGGKYLESYIMHAGDTILLVSGGHGFECLNEVEMIEVKQGPFAGDQDKTLLPAVEPDAIRIKRHGPIHTRQPAKALRQRAAVLNPVH